MHDACYTEIAYDGYEPPSFLQVSGAKDVGIEFHNDDKMEVVRKKVIAHMS